MPPFEAFSLTAQQQHVINMSPSSKMFERRACLPPVCLAVQGKVMPLPSYRSYSRGAEERRSCHANRLMVPLPTDVCCGRSSKPGAIFPLKRPQRSGSRRATAAPARPRSHRSQCLLDRLPIGVRSPPGADQKESSFCCCARQRQRPSIQRLTVRFNRLARRRQQTST
jgi:hypothetical protein